MSCDGKVAVIVGGTRGIGRAATLALADAGATVVPTGRSKTEAEEVAALARERGVSSLALPFDIREPAMSEEAMATVQDHFGSIDVLVANAGINPYFTRAEHLTADNWDEIMNVNLRGLFFVIQAAARRMLEGDGGSIVSVSSVTATKGVKRGLPYTASKGGLDAMTRTLAVEWADRGVRVNAVAPGYIETDLTVGLRTNRDLRQMILSKLPIGRFGTADEVAASIVFLASDAASYMTGQVLVLDGGMQAS